MDSAIGLSLMIAIGPERFGELLSGFHTVDRHFRETPLADNVPGPSSNGSSCAIPVCKSRVRALISASKRNPSLSKTPETVISAAPPKGCPLSAR